MDTAVSSPGLWQLIREDWEAHGRDWTKPGFRATAIHRFGVWRMRLHPEVVRAPFSLVYRWFYRRARNHYGIDLPAPNGAPVVATAPGTVMRIDEGGPGGLEVIVQHKGFIGVYSHFGTISPVLVEGKTYVTAGENLGVVGKSGIVFGSHL